MRYLIHVGIFALIAGGGAALLTAVAINTDRVISSRLGTRVQTATLWDRIERAPTRGLHTLGHFVAIVVAVEAAVLPMSLVADALIPFEPFSQLETMGLLTWSIYIAMRPLLYGFVVVVGALVRHKASRDEALGVLATVTAPKGAFTTSKRALADAAVALGSESRPGLRVLDVRGLTTDAVNAAIIPGHRGRSAVYITPGFAEQFTLAEQRAVFAHLLARDASGDARRELDQSIGIGATVSAVAGFVGDHPWMTLIGVGAWVWGLLALGSGAARIPGTDSKYLAPVMMLHMMPVAFAVFCLAWQGMQRWALRGPHTLSATYWDAMAVFALKEPEAVLSALRTFSRGEGRVPGAWIGPGLFYTWPFEQPPAVTSLEAQRIERLARVLPVSIA